MTAAALPFVITVAGMAALYGDIALKLAHEWGTDPNYSHGFLIPPVAAYLAWERRHRVARVMDTPSWWGLPIVGLAVAVLAAGVLGAQLFLARVSLPLMLAGAVVSLMGWPALRILSFPIGLLLLAIPLPGMIFTQLTFPLQLLASRAAEFALQAAGVPVLREGNIITLANVSLEVAEACSGVRSLVTLLTLAIVFGYVVDRRRSIRILLALASVPVAIAANGIRVAGTGIAAHYVGAKAAEGFLHEFSGWVVFVVALVLLAALQRLVARFWPDRSPRPPADEPCAVPRAAPLAPAIAVTALLVLAAVAIRGASVSEVPPPRERFDAFPAQVGSWRSIATQPLSPDVVSLLRVTDYLNRVYASPADGAVGLYIAYHESQRGGESMHSPLNCLPGSGWQPVSHVRVPLDSGGTSLEASRRPPVNRVVIQKGLDTQVVIYWYQTHGRVVASEYAGKLYTMLDAVRLNRTDAALVRIMCPASSDSPAAIDRAGRSAESFVHAIVPLLGRFIPE